MKLQSVNGQMVLILIIISLFCPGLQAQVEHRPNIIFIYADDWGYGDLSCHGSSFIKTPNIDKMAAEGIDFCNFSVCNPVCSPSRTAIITGQFPARNSVHGHFATVESHMNRNMPDWLNPQAPMLPRMLKNSGYVCGHFGKWHLSNTHVSDAPSPLVYGYDEFSCFNVSSQFRQMSADSSLYKTIDFIERHKDNPFFVNVWIHATHTPHYPKEQYLEKFNYLDEQQQVYASVVSEADYRIGLLFKKLKELHLDENTLVIFSSDNGPEITGNEAKKLSIDNSTGPGYGTYYSVGETGGLKGRKRSLYAGGVRTPFIARWPGVIPAGQKDSTTAIAGVDMLPTFLEFAGIALPDGYKPDGESIVEALKGHDFKREKTIYWQWNFSNVNRDYWQTAGIQEDNWKFLINEKTGRKELYDISKDWAEKHNLVSKFPDKVKSMESKISDWEKTLPSKPPQSCFSKERTLLSTGEKQEIDQPNIIFIFADDWGYGDLSLHGNTWQETPNIDQMAKEGIDFTNFTVNSPVCSPSRTAVMTGQFPARNSIHQHLAGVKANQKRGMADWLNPDVPILPRLFHEAGYTTGHFGKWHLGSCEDSPPESDYGYDSFATYNGSKIHNILPSGLASVDHAEEFIRENKDKPFFVNLWLHETHLAHFPQEKYMEEYKNLDEQKQVYASVIAEGDEGVGRILNLLKELGLDQKTLVVFSSDNGPEATRDKEHHWFHGKTAKSGYGGYFSVGETAGLTGQKRSLYAGGIRVPFIARWPGVVPEGKVDKNSVITAVDLMPTFLEAAGIEMPENFEPDGESAFAAFKGETFKRSKPIFWEWKGGISKDYTWPSIGVRDGKWKLMMNKDLGRIELYDLEADWAEKHDVAADNPDIVKNLTEKVDIWKASLPTKPDPRCVSSARENKNNNQN